MTKTLIAVAVMALLSPLALADTPIGSGHIVAGTPATVFVVTDLDTFAVPAPAAGTLVTTSTTDGSGLGYDLDIYFLDASGEYIRGSACATDAADERCTVPAGAVEVEVSAFFGADLHVTVLAVG